MTKITIDDSIGNKRNSYLTKKTLYELIEVEQASDQKLIDSFMTAQNEISMKICEENAQQQFNCMKCCYLFNKKTSLIPIFLDYIVTDTMRTMMHAIFGVDN